MIASVSVAERVVPLVAERLNALGHPAKAALHEEWLQAQQRCAGLAATFSSVTPALADLGGRVVAVKGAALRSAYERQSLRDVSDLDLAAIDQRAADEARECLLAAGWRCVANSGAEATYQRAGCLPVDVTVGLIARAPAVAHSRERAVIRADGLACAGPVDALTAVLAGAACRGIIRDRDINDAVVALGDSWDCEQGRAIAASGPVRQFLTSATALISARAPKVATRLAGAYGLPY
jgi:hypothetical protein